MFLAEIDPVQIIIIVIAMGAGFIQWLWGLLKQKLEENERRNAPPLTPEDRAAREEAWRRQTQQSGGPPPRPSPKTPPPIHDPWSTVRDVFEQIKDEARKAQNPDAPAPAQPQRPSQPPQLPSAQRSRPGTVRADLRPGHASATTPPPVPAASFPPPPAKAVTPPVHFAQPVLPPVVTRSKPVPFDLGKLLLNSASARQAVLLREILGPPKALQSSSDSPF